MELKWLDDYIALIELGSFSKAAEARFVTQPAFSRRIRSLESWLGVSLVDRNQHPTALTPAGQAFAEQARLLSGQILAVRRQMQDISAARAQLVIISQQALAVSFFPSWMQTLQALSGGALIKVETGHLQENIQSFLAGDGDFLLCYSSAEISAQLHRDDVESLQVGVDQFVPVTALNPQGQPRYGHSSDEPLKLVAHPAESFFGDILQRDCLPHLNQDQPIEIACENALSEALKALVLQGYGMAWLPLSLIRRELDNADLQLLSEEFPRVDLSIRLYRLRQPRSQSAGRFWQYLQDMYNQNHSPVG
ncbi:LysR family transcriptional regulator [Granulosicoccus antarcticus]|uniref:HTH-type transcriptional regulator YjiE n=1 Tax=Granulosicoccus antarcticus IMCC3135 TaxID=1192854 RepID=A0A2Z2P697_9GAMM|nr:LysR family transcriptional regulator [Granulosicoccus antarcticus]ASJ76227.1 HTH-type transcriptional regulator YjiE [Granulosicoccus antarcticus IMCC3135]